jgi:hypothetical protein
MTILDLPPIDATLNGVSTLLICDEIVRLIGAEKWANSLSGLALWVCDQSLFYVVSVLSIDSL